MSARAVIKTLKRLNSPNRQVDFTIAQLVGYSVKEDGKEYVDRDGRTRKEVSWYHPSGVRIKRVPFFTLKVDEAIILLNLVAKEKAGGLVWEIQGASAQLEGGPVAEGFSPAVALCIAILEVMNR